MKRLLLVAALAALAPLAVQAESSVATGTGSLAANANLDFSITVPKVLFLQVGTGTFSTTGTAPVLTSYGTNAAIDKIDFALPAGGIGNGTPVAGTGGDQSAGAVTVRVLGNNGTVSLTNTVNGRLSSGVSGNPTVPWSDITVTSSALASTSGGFTNTGIAHPIFNTAAGGGTSTAISLAATGGLVRQEGKWTFAYANTAMLPGGTYGSTPANNGRVLYTATTP